MIWTGPLILDLLTLSRSLLPWPPAALSECSVLSFLRSLSTSLPSGGGTLHLSAPKLSRPRVSRRWCEPALAFTAGLPPDTRPRTQQGCWVFCWRCSSGAQSGQGGAAGAEVIG